MNQAGGKRQLPKTALGGLLGDTHMGEAACLQGPAVTRAQRAVADQQDFRQVHTVAPLALQFGQG